MDGSGRRTRRAAKWARLIVNTSNLESASFPREVVVKDGAYSIPAKPPASSFLGSKCRRAPLSSDYQQKNKALNELDMSVDLNENRSTFVHHQKTTTTRDVKSQARGQ